MESRLLIHNYFSYPAQVQVQIDKLIFKIMIATFANERQRTLFWCMEIQMLCCEEFHARASNITGLKLSAQAARVGRHGQVGYVAAWYIFSHLKMPCNSTETDSKDLLWVKQKSTSSWRKRENRICSFLCKHLSLLALSNSSLNVASWLLSPCIIVSAALRQSKTYQSTPAMSTHSVRPWWQKIMTCTEMVALDFKRQRHLDETTSL